MPNQSLIRLRHLTKRFDSGGASVVAVDDVSLDIFPGEIVLIMGPSGSGKTTLLSMMGGLLRPTSGSVVVAGRDIAAMPEHELPKIRALNVGFVFQAFNLLHALTVEENVLLPAQLAPGGVKTARDHVSRLLVRLNLDRRRKAYPGTLSGGERQRVAIARALVNRPPLILADEPTGNLDSRTGQDVTMILHDVARDEGCAVVIVTHDQRIEEVADRILWLEDGRIRDRGDDDHLWVRDPVCGMRVDERTSNFSVNFTGQRYTFCSRRCLERFNANPQAFLTEKVGKTEMSDNV